MPFKSEKQRRYLFANEPEIAKKWSKEYNMGGVASMFRKRLAEGDDPFYEAWKKIYEQNPDAAAMNEKHEEYLQKYELEMSMQTSDAPMEETEDSRKNPNIPLTIADQSIKEELNHSCCLFLN